MSEQRNWACSYVHSYFDNAWSGPDVTAQAALDQAKAAAVRDLQRKIESVEGVSFGAFRDRCLHESVEPSTVRHPVGAEA